MLHLAFEPKFDQTRAVLAAWLCMRSLRESESGTEPSSLGCTRRDMGSTSAVALKKGSCPVPSACGAGVSCPARAVQTCRCRTEGKEALGVSAWAVLTGCSGMFTKMRRGMRRTRQGRVLYFEVHCANIQVRGRTVEVKNKIHTRMSTHDAGKSRYFLFNEYLGATV